MPALTVKQTEQIEKIRLAKKAKLASERASPGGGVRQKMPVLQTTKKLSAAEEKKRRNDKIAKKAQRKLDRYGPGRVWNPKKQVMV